MGGKSVKSEMMLEEAEVRALIKDLAERIGLGGELDLQNVDKLSLSVKLSEGKGEAKLKVYFPQDKAPDGADHNGLTPDEAVIKYSKLKKRMKRDFKALGDALAAGNLPEEALVERFLGDSHLMVCFPGYGDEFYLEYNKATKAFTKAWEARELEKLQAGHLALHACMKSCHEKYK